jgi:hypothetical protein
MSRARDVAFAVASVAFGAFWVATAALKLSAPLESYEMLTRLAPPGAAAKAAFVAGVTIEALLGAAMALRAVSAVRGFALSLAWLAVLAGTLVLVLRSPVPPTSCGCLGAAVNVTPQQQLLLDGAMGALLLGLIGWGLLFDRGRDELAA